MSLPECVVFWEFPLEEEEESDSPNSPRLQLIPLLEGEGLELGSHLFFLLGQWWGGGGGGCSMVGCKVGGAIVVMPWWGAMLQWWVKRGLGWINWKAQASTTPHDHPNTFPPFLLTPTLLSPLHSSSISPPSSSNLSTIPFHRPSIQLQPSSIPFHTLYHTFAVESTPLPHPTSRGTRPSSPKTSPNLKTLLPHWGIPNHPQLTIAAVPPSSRSSCSSSGTLMPMLRMWMGSSSSLSTGVLASSKDCCGGSEGGLLWFEGVR